MDSGSGRKWLLNAFLVFLPGIFLWILAVVWTASSTAGQYNFLAGLKSHLFADYSPDAFGQSMKSLKLAIFGDVFSDSISSSEEMSALDKAMQGLVPTATLEQAALLLTLTPITSSTEVPILLQNPSSTPNPTTTPKNLPEATKTVIVTVTPKATEKVPTATASRQKVDPILDCVVDNGDDSFTAYFSYKNHNSFEVSLHIGIDNKFTPGVKDRGQPTLFSPGRSPTYPSAVFQVTFDGEPLTWHLDGGATTASAASNFCEPIVPETEEDTKSPIIIDGIMDPAPGELASCSMTITVNNLRVTDPAPSSGIDWVRLKYKVVDYTDLIYSDPLTLCSGGATQDGGWDGCYKGSILIEINPTWPAPESGPFLIDLYAKTMDGNGNSVHKMLGQYTMPACCGVCE